MSSQKLKNINSQSASQNTISTISLKSKKSRNFLSTIKRVIMKKSKTSTTTFNNIHLGSTVNSSSSITVVSEELNHEENISKCETSEQNSKSTVTEIEIFNQDLTRSQSSNIIKHCPKDFNTATATQVDISDTKIDSMTDPDYLNAEGKSSVPSLSKVIEQSAVSVQVTIPDIRKTDQSYIDINRKLEKAQNLANQLKESQDNFIKIFTKYIRDPKLLQELVQIVTQHTKIHGEAEKKTCSVINLIWIQKLEEQLKHERQLKDTVNELIKENRELQMEKVQLVRTTSLPCKTVQNLQDFPSVSPLDMRMTCSCDEKLDRILRECRKMEEKLKMHHRQVEGLEEELSSSQMQCEVLETEVRSVNGELQSVKAQMERSNGDHNLEIVALNVKLLTNEKYLKALRDASDELLEDLGKLKEMPMFSVNWTKLKHRGNGGTEAISLARLYLSELTKEMGVAVERAVEYQNKINLLEQEKENLKAELSDALSELVVISKKTGDVSQHSFEINECEGKINSLENDCRTLEEELNKSKLDYDEKLISLNNLIANYEKLIKELHEKEQVLANQTSIIETLYKENYSLNLQIESLQKVIKEIGSGDNPKTNIEIPQLQAEYFQLLKDKESLLTQIDGIKEDNRILLSNQQKYYDHSMKNKNEVQTLNKELQHYKHKLSVEHQTLVSLQKERKKYLEEKSTLKTIFQHMKTEMDRMQKLEGTVLDISKENNRLALIADFNKQIGDKLKDEVVQRDNTINELRDNMEKLSIIQVENTKEKLSLCHELSEVCNIKKQLSDVLTMEVQKNYQLNETYKDLENTATTQAKKFQEKEMTERESVKELFDEFKKIVAERDQLQQLKDKYLKEIKDLQSNFKNIQKKLDLLITKNSKKEHKIVQLTESMKTTETEHQKTQNKLMKDLSEYKNRVASAEKDAERMKNEKHELQETVSYLKNNTQKLHNDLNDARCIEKNLKDAIRRFEAEFDVTDSENQQLKRTLNGLSSDKDKLMAEIEYVNNLCEKVLSDFELNIKTSTEKEEIWKKELEDARKQISKYEMEVELMKKELAAGNSNETKDCSEHTRLIVMLEKENYSLRRELFNTEDKYKKCADDLKKKTSDCNNYHKKYKEIHERKSKETSELKEEIKKLEDKCKDETTALNNEIQSLNKQIAALNESLENQKKANVSIQLYNEVSAKYLTSTTELMNEKQSLQEVLRTLESTKEAMYGLEREKQDLRDQISKTLDILNREKQQIEDLTKEKDEISRELGEVSMRCSALEMELKDASQSEMESTKMEYLRTTENRARMLKKELDNSYDMIVNLKDELSNFQQQITTLEFERCELTLRLHESQGNLETEKTICQQLRQANQLILSTILQMKDEGKVGPLECNELLMKLESVTHDAGDSNLFDITYNHNLDN